MRLLKKFAIAFIILVSINLSPAINVSSLSIDCSSVETGSLIQSAIKDDRIVLEGTVLEAKALSSTDISNGAYDNNVLVTMEVGEVYRSPNVEVNSRINFRGIRDAWASP